MPAYPPGQLIRAVLLAIEDSGYSGILLNHKMQEHPRRLLITGPDNSAFVAWVYIWTLTFGGRVNLPDEFRIQMTTVKPPLGTNPDGPTVLMGYEPDLGLFTGFDLERHRRFSPGSPMVSIDLAVAREALQNGLSFHRKSNQEIAIGVRPDHLVDYIVNAPALHRFGRNATVLHLMQRATALEEIMDEDVEMLSENRQRIVQTVSRLSRKGNFKQQVLNAYGNRCAVTRAQLRLVDAAHILPVGAPESVDDVRNGLALAPTYHRAYDNGLIYLDETFVMRINPAKGQDLEKLRLHGGIERFRAPLGKILLPADRRQWPHSSFIRRANAFRRIAV